jgi:hypothetical protein
VTVTLHARAVHGRFARLVTSAHEGFDIREHAHRAVGITTDRDLHLAGQRRTCILVDELGQDLSAILKVCVEIPIGDVVLDVDPDARAVPDLEKRIKLCTHASTKFNSHICKQLQRARAFTGDPSPQHSIAYMQQRLRVLVRAKF